MLQFRDYFVLFQKTAGRNLRLSLTHSRFNFDSERQAMQQATAGQPLTPRVQKDVDRRQAEMMPVIKEILDWNKLEPMDVRV